MAKGYCAFCGKHKDTKKATVTQFTVTQGLKNSRMDVCEDCANNSPNKDAIVKNPWNPAI